MKIKLYLLVIVLSHFISVKADQTVQRSLTLNVGQTKTETTEGGNGCTITNQYQDVVTCEYQGSHKFVFTGLKRGNASITISVPGYKYIYSVHVVDVIGITIPATISLSLGDSYSFEPIIADNGATTTLSWISSNTSVATISNNGVLTTKGVGATTVTCEATNGISAQCTVIVNPVLVSDILLNTSEENMTVGEQLQLLATIQPIDATDQTVIWSSTNESVAVVSEGGLVTAVGSGSCQIKATANDGSGKTASCLVIVEKNNKLTVTDLTQCSGGRSAMSVLLTDEETIIGFQFDLQLPNGVTVPVNDNGSLMASLTGNAVNTHIISSNEIGDGLYRFIVTSSNGKPITSVNGDGLSITIDVADDVAEGVYVMTIKNIEMTVRKDGNVYEDVHPKDNSAMLTVTEALLGDVNGDGRISVTDVISLNSYIQEEIPARFILKAADLNGDGKISITDAVWIIDIILDKQ